MIHDLRVNSSSSNATYILPEIEIGLCGPHRSACISCNLFVVGVILFDFIILMCLLLMQALQSSSILSMFSSIVLLIGEDLIKSELNSSLESEEWGSSIGLIISPRLIPSISLKTWITLALLA